MKKVISGVVIATIVVTLILVGIGSAAAWQKDFPSWMKQPEPMSWDNNPNWMSFEPIVFEPIVFEPMPWDNNPNWMEQPEMPWDVEQSEPVPDIKPDFESMFAWLMQYLIPFHRMPF